MIARAPGKLVLSGAYSVLRGAPAIVTAVDRYAIADAARAPSMVTPEVRAAIEAGAIAAAPWFDASELRAVTADGSRKLGLGSSAAILVASMVAARPRSSGPGAAIFEVALAAHRAAQGGGSGVDVAASAFGGTFVARRSPNALATRAHELPSGIVVAVFTSATAASTSSFVARVAALASKDPKAHARLLDHAGEGAEAAARATTIDDLVRAIDAQTDALGELGEAAGVPIVTADVAGLRPIARAERAAFAPSGAGGGDVAIFVGGAPPSPDFVERAGAEGLALLPIVIGARGVHYVA